MGEWGTYYIITVSMSCILVLAKQTEAIHDINVYI